MILKNKRDVESFIREKNVSTMKENPYLEENDIVVTSTGNAYKVVSTITEIPLLNDLFAEIITQDIDGNITSANKLSTARNISLKGDVDGNINFDGTKDVSINVTVNNDSHTHSNATIENLDASKITSGTIDIARLPKGALERLVKVQDDTARFALTTNSVQLGDTVHVVNTNKMYIVIDESKLNSESGYQIYVAGRAAEVPWSGVTDKPTTMPNPNPLTISLNGSSQGAYDGNTSKNINITPSSIGAAASSHGVHVTYGSINPKIASSSPSAGVSSDVSRADHVHLEQTNIAGNAGTATKLETPRNINGHSFDGTSDITLVPKDIGAEPAFVKNTAFNKNFGTDVNTVLEGNKLAEMLGGTYAGSLNNSNQKTVDSIYYDSTTKQFYKCIKAGTVNYADASYFTSVSMKSLSDRLDNLFGSDFSKIGYYNCKSLLDVGTVITINLNKNISNFTFILITFSDSGYNDIFHSYTIPVLLFKNYNLSFRFTIEPYMDLICSNPAYNDFINFKYKSEQEITFEVYRKNNNKNNYDTNNYITIYGFKL